MTENRVYRLFTRSSSNDKLSENQFQALLQTHLPERRLGIKLVTLKLSLKAIKNGRAISDSALPIYPLNAYLANSIHPTCFWQN
jgi:hypothetical protein